MYCAGKWKYIYYTSGNWKSIILYFSHTYNRYYTIIKTIIRSKNKTSYTLNLDTSKK